MAVGDTTKLNIVKDLSGLQNSLDNTKSYGITFIGKTAYLVEVEDVVDHVIAVGDTVNTVGGLLVSIVAAG